MSANSTTRLDTFNIAGTQVRGFFEGQQLWFIVKDVATALGIGTHNLSRGVEPDEYGLVKINTNGGPQTVKTINVAGLIHYVYSSRKPQALELRRAIATMLQPAIIGCRRTSFVPSVSPQVVTSKVTTGVDPREERMARQKAMRYIRG